MRSRTRLLKIVIGLFRPEYLEQTQQVDVPYLRIYEPDSSPDDAEPTKKDSESIDST